MSRTYSKIFTYYFGIAFFDSSYNWSLPLQANFFFSIILYILIRYTHWWIGYALEYIHIYVHINMISVSSWVDLAMFVSLYTHEVVPKFWSYRSKFYKRPFLPKSYPFVGNADIVTNMNGQLFQLTNIFTKLGIAYCPIQHYNLRTYCSVQATFAAKKETLGIQLYFDS